MPHVVEGTLHAYLDGELPSAERKALEAHLAECASCRAMLDEERALLDRATALLGAARPADRPAPPFEQLSRSRSPRRSPWHVRTPVAWAASITLALGLGYYLRQPAAPFANPAPEQHADSRMVGLYREGERGDVAAKEASAPASKPAAAPASGRAGAARGARGVEGRAHDSAMVLADEAAKAEVQERPRADSVTAATRAANGVVVIPPPSAVVPQLRTAAPAAVAVAPSAAVASSAVRDSPMLEAVVVSGAQSGQVARIRGRASTTSWPIISHGTARSLLGTDPVGLPGLARNIRRSPANDGTVVVEQKIDSATTIQIFQRQNAAAGFAYDSAVPSERLQQYDRLARYVGSLRVEISGPLSTDSLNKLLNQVQPLP